MTAGVYLMKKKYTTQDIAKMLDISRTTVSKALNQHPSVPEETRQAVLEAAARVGYKSFKEKLKPHAVLAAPGSQDGQGSETAGPALYGTHSGLDVSWNTTGVSAAGETGQRRAFAFLINSSKDVLHEGYWMDVLRGVEEAARRHNYEMIFHFASAEDAEEGNLLDKLAHPRLGGILLAGLTDFPYVKAVQDLNIPAVSIDGYCRIGTNDLYCDVVLMECEQSVYELTGHLLQLGHREIGFIGDIDNCRSFTERWFGFRRAMFDAGIGVQPEYCLVSPMPKHYYSPEELEPAIRAMPKLPSAFVCANDLIALQLSKILTRMDVRIPGQISVTGFDHMTRWWDSSPVQLRLSTVEAIGKDLGQRAFEQLLWRMGNPHRPFENIRISSRVLLGDTTGPAPLPTTAN